MSNSIKQNLEKELAALAQCTHGLLMSRGATALFISYSVLKKIAQLQSPSKIRNRIVLPAIMCHSPANVALYAGLEQVFCDADPLDYTLDADHLERLLETTPGILAVLSVSIFGHAPDMKRISDICKKHQVYLIDDAAQSIGGSSDGKPFGGWGDIGIYSFGHTKIIDVGWGGAIVTNDALIYEECKNAYEALDLPSPAIQELRSVYSETYYTVERLEQKSLTLAPLFWNFPEMFNALYVYKEVDFPELKMTAILEKLKQLKEHNEARMLLWKVYADHLVPNEYIQLPVLRAGSTPWRFTCRIKKEKRTMLVNALRAQRIDVSTWYPSLQKRFKPAEKLKIIPCHAAMVLNDELFNLWIDPATTTTLQVKTTCDLINKLITGA